MNKKYIDEFYSRVEKDKKHEIFALSLPMFLANKHIYNESESFYKTNYDLLHSDIDVLAALYFSNENHSLSPTELYDATIFSSGGMTKVLKKLEDREFITRDVSKEDKRKTFVTLTKKGVVLIESCICEASKRLENHFKVLSQKEKNDLKKILSKLIYSMI
ncbi:winged helix DNA-binding protein [Aliarcobacter cryaerophilus]|jgi:DNA-binding MarR family transcriptional regulator|uniref:MarR family winged helix-turn-helix transcriptional regulator n=1 Tax=Aliarcobacter cryaerophilus TaxID=28198 RepID=UPI00112F745A|nr:MarR family transcriptional regulator [Aliarcobacter cryaerophilus]MDD2974061.1 winged helix DNA-binding protein [Aliarcobacter cryaerophilus]MDX9815227.1 winged helix DNA-binding protein [Sulfurimonadaceae bacterium]